MKWKTKVLSIVLSGLMLCSLYGCGDSSENTSASNSTSESVVSASSESSSEDTSMDSADTLDEFDTSATISETVMYEENDVKITATGLNYTGYSVEVELTIENNSSKNLSFYSNTMGYSCNSVNGYMISDGYLNCDVAAGKKANDSLSFGYNSLMLYGINKIADIEIGFDISDEDRNKTYSGPRQIVTTAYDGYNYSKDSYLDTITSDAAMNTYNYEMACFSEDTLYEANGINLLSSGVMINQDGDHILLLELENTTSDMIYVSTTDIILNGLAIYDSTWSNNAINAGKCSVVDVDLSSVLDEEYGEAYDITDIGSVKLSLIQKDSEGSILVEATSMEVIIPESAEKYDATGTEIYNIDGLRIVSKAVLESHSEYNSDMYVLLLVDNNSGSDVTIDDVHDSLSVNGYMTDYFFYSKEINDGESAAMKIRLDETSLEDNGIAATSDITEVEVGLEIKQGSNTVDEPVVKITF